MIDKLKVKSSKGISKGFALYESQYRRLIDLSKEQVEKEIFEDSYVEKYKIAYENGVVAETSSIDEVLEQENFGQASIVSLQATIGNNINDDQPPKILLSFDSDNSKKGSPIFYSIDGSSRDWVFVTSSLIEERIASITMPQWTLLKIKPNGYMSIILLSLILTTFLVQTNTFSSWLYSSLGLSQEIITLDSFQDENQEIIYSEEIRQSYEDGETTNAIEAIILLEELKSENSKLNDAWIEQYRNAMLERGETRGNAIVISYIILFSVPTIVCLLVFIMSVIKDRYYPPFEFC
ncbi:MAG: hypothetical protein AAF267_14775 [Deinococcota bacterium]